MAGGHQPGKGGYIEAIVTVRIKLYRWSSGEQVSWRNDQAQSMQRLAQVQTGGRFRLFRPEQPGQSVASVGLIRLYGQVSQQSLNLGRFKMCHHLPGQVNLERSK